MMKLRLFLKNSVNPARNSLFLLIFPLVFILGCSAANTDTFVFTKENITEAIQNISKKEYDIEVKAKLTGDTLWVYIPVEDIFEKSERPEKYTEKFSIEQNQSEIDDKTLRTTYAVKVIPKNEKYQEAKYKEDTIEKTSNVLKIVRRVLLSIDRKKSSEPKFLSILTADIKNGILIQHVSYYLDLKKVTYGYIPWNEYSHRDIQEISLAPQIVGDKDGKNIQYHDIAMKDFITAQIAQRIKLKFQKPEVEPGVDIDKEVIRIIAITTKIYDFQDFSEAELINLATSNKVVFSRAALLDNATER